MKIALTAPLYTIGGDGAGGIGTFVALLADQLTKRGHSVDVLTVADSTVVGNKIAIWEKSIFADAQSSYTVASLEIAGSVKAYQLLIQPHAYDVIHNNKVDFYGYAAIAALPNCLTTFHQSADSPGLAIARSLRPETSQANYVAISDFQKASIDLNFAGRVYNGIDLQQFTFQPSAEPYVAWMARLDPDKGIEDTLQAIAQAKVPLRFAGSKRDEAYYQKIIETAKQQNATFLGHVDPQQRNELLGKARAFIFPTKWPEPFGLVVAEAMACGTPVITYDNGAMSELVIDRVTGYVCPPNDVAALTEAIKQIMTMPEPEYRAMRLACRKRVEENFTIERMVDQYEALYATIASEA